jgi:hypothetical protein
MDRHETQVDIKIFRCLLLVWIVNRLMLEILIKRMSA